MTGASAEPPLVAGTGTVYLIYGSFTAVGPHCLQYRYIVSENFLRTYSINKTGHISNKNELYVFPPADGKPGVYTNVLEHVSWLYNMMEEEKGGSCLTEVTTCKQNNGYFI
jgi:hypothetical protein